MSQHLPQEKIEEIQQASDIINVISDYVVLKNVGKNHIGLCPFHNEKTPSFTVNPERQFYKCFGCGEAGTVFTFLMKHDGIKFPDAVRTLADRANIVLPKTINSVKTRDENNVLFSINNHFSKFYHKTLMSGNLAKHARKYIADRSIGEESIKKFAIGYSPSSWDSSLKEAATQKFKTDDLENAGIVLQKKNGKGLYDRFRGRVMFPIFNEVGSGVGFGARTLENSQPKYINSPESKIFSKRRILYGLNFAKDAIIKRNETIIMEGYTDVIMAHQYGIDWTVGVMGTSLTHEHAKLINRYCKQVVLVLDADEAGIKSADKSANLLIEEGLDVKIVQLPEGSDPCEFLISNGKDALIKQLENADDFFGFKIKIARLRGHLKTVSDKARVFNEIITTAMKIPDILKQNIQIKEIAEYIKIDETEVRKHLDRLNGNGLKNTYSNRKDQYPQTLNISTFHKKKQKASYQVETNLIRLMILDNKYIPLVRSSIGIERFEDKELHSIVEAIFDAYDSSGGVSEAKLFSLLADTELHQPLVDITCNEPLNENSEDVFKGCKQYFNRRLSRHEIRKTKAQTKELESELKTNNRKDLNLLLDKFHKENKRLQSLKNRKKRTPVSALNSKVTV
ncbi:MAG: DNA primase [Candidatus Anammoxibacter sp.]